MSLLKMDMSRNSKLRNELSGTLTISIEGETLYQASAPLDSFIKWYVIGLPYILKEAPLPFDAEKSYSQNLRKSLDALDPQKRHDIFNISYLFLCTYSAFEDMRHPYIYIVKRGEKGEISHSGRVYSPTENIFFKSGDWAYLFDLSKFVPSTKATIVKFLREANDETTDIKLKEKIYRLILMSESIKMRDETKNNI